MLLKVPLRLNMRLRSIPRLRTCPLIWFVLIAITTTCLVLIWTIDSGSGSSPAKQVVHEVELPIPSVVLTDPSYGLGNQLFKYAFGYALAQQLNASLFLKYQKPSRRRFGAGERSFALDQFELDETKFQTLSEWETLPKNNTTRISEVNYFEKRIPTNKIIVVEDFWVSELFFKPYADEIIAQYKMKVSFNDSDIYKQIEATESVAVHCRLGDFKSSHRILPFSYTLRAMDLVQTLVSRQLTFFIFSDNIRTVQSQMEVHLPRFGGPTRVVFVSNSATTSIQEFYLMCACKHTIVANSTFSWWVAYLNAHTNKTVIAPQPRNRPKFFDGYHNPRVKKYKQLLSDKHSYPAGWLTLDPFVDEEPG